MEYTDKDDNYEIDNNKNETEIGDRKDSLWQIEK